jgi:hypothetical protein
MNNSENLTVPGWEDEEYLAFVDKFKAKRTTDDCYTPPLVYDAVADWVATEYGLDKENFVRPFYPGGDYEREVYLPDAVVVDNPPFSIVTQICKFYLQHGIRFFLFAPALTLFSGLRNVTYLPCGVQVTYENGAEVPTSFVTNLEPEIQVRCAPSLFRAVDQANKENLKASKEILPKYTYPDHILTPAIAQRWCKYGVAYTLRREDCLFVRVMDAQKTKGKTIFGGGLLLSTRAAAERAAAERAAAERAAAERAAAIQWQLSEKEKMAVAYLDRKEAL